MKIGKSLGRTMGVLALMAAVSIAGCGEAPAAKEEITATQQKLATPAATWMHNGLSLTNASTGEWVDGTGNVYLERDCNVAGCTTPDYYVYYRNQAWGGRVACEIRMIRAAGTPPSWVAGVARTNQFYYTSRGNGPTSGFSCWEHRPDGTWVKKNLGDGEVRVYDTTDSSSTGVEVWMGTGSGTLSGYTATQATSFLGTL